MASRYPKTMYRDYKAAHHNVCVAVCGGTWSAPNTADLVTIVAGHLPEPARILEETKA